MPLNENIKNWRNRPHGKRQQAQVICHILERLEYFDSIGYTVPMSRLYKECEDSIRVCRTTSRKWWLSFELYGELPYETAAHIKRVRKKFRWLPEGTKINERELLVLKGILDKSPSLYLDEIALIFGMETGKYIHHTTLWRYITENLNYSLQCLNEKALQQSEVARDDFKRNLHRSLQDRPEMLVMVDQTHKDRNAARRRR